MSDWVPEWSSEWHGRAVAFRVAEAQPRCRAVLSGSVRQVVVHSALVVRAPAGQRTRGAAVDAWLDDGSGTIVVRWLGRVAVAGVTTGASLRVEGTVSEVAGQLVILNPIYRFERSEKPAHPESSTS